MTGNVMKGGRLSAHARLFFAASVPAPYRTQARELRDEGVCQYVNSSIEFLEMPHGERNRSDSQQGGDGNGGRPAQRIRQRQRVHGSRILGGSLI